MIVVCVFDEKPRKKLCFMENPGKNWVSPNNLCAILNPGKNWVSPKNLCAILNPEKNWGFPDNLIYGKSSS